jgi:uncharacterized protein (DUF1684 family)
MRRLVCILAALVACASPSPRPAFDFAAYRADIEKWKAERLKEVAGDGGWITLTGLYWLEPDDNRFGADSGNAIVLSPRKSPPYAGLLRLIGDTVWLVPSPTAGMRVDGQSADSGTLRIRTDADSAPTKVQMGSLALTVIRRHGRTALRVKDTQHPALKQFAGIELFPLDTAWRRSGRFERYTPAHKIPIVDVTGAVEDYPSPGAVVFEAGGSTQRLDVLEDTTARDYWILFRDATSGRETYGAGRYLHVPLPDADGNVVVDFNRAYNPPCAFTAYATCPLPPRQNRLSIAIPAGERRYAEPEISSRR